jgi:hypothetical protein
MVYFSLYLTLIENRLKLFRGLIKATSDIVHMLKTQPHKTRHLFFSGPARVVIIAPR